MDFAVVEKSQILMQFTVLRLLTMGLFYQVKALIVRVLKKALLLNFQTTCLTIEFFLVQMKSTHLTGFIYLDPLEKEMEQMVLLQFLIQFCCWIQREQ